MEKFRQIKQIGEGAFGKALLVESKTDKVKYVIKEVNMAKMSAREKQESRRECSVLREMRHPNIISFVDSFERGTRLYIVMDFADGGDLANKLAAQRGKLLPEQQVIDWFVQLCLAMKHVHDRKILHRDLKTQNIFLTKDNMIKLGDFGIAKVLKNTRDLARTQIGTPYYFSPEICDGKPYNNKSDVWSLGVVLYEMLTLKHPFDGRSMQQLVVKICRGNYRPVNPKYSQDVQKLMKSMMNLSQSKRPSVNGILKKTFIQRRISEFLEETILQDEFSHTVLHGARGKLGAAGNKPVLGKIGAPSRAPGVKKPVSRVAAGGRSEVARGGVPSSRAKQPAARAAQAARRAPAPAPSRPSSTPQVQSRGNCGVCKKPVMTDQDRTQDDEGIYFHIECLQKERQAARKIDRQQSDEDVARGVAAEKQKAADAAAAKQQKKEEQAARESRERDRQQQREREIREEREKARNAAQEREREEKERYQAKLQDRHKEFLARRKAGLANKRRLDEAMRGNAAQAAMGGGGGAMNWVGVGAAGAAGAAAPRPSGARAPPAAAAAASKVPAGAKAAAGGGGGADNSSLPAEEVARRAAVAEYNERMRQAKANRLRAEEDADDDAAAAAAAAPPASSRNDPAVFDAPPPRKKAPAKKKAPAAKKKAAPPKAALDATMVVDKPMDLGATFAVQPKKPTIPAKVSKAAEQRAKLRDMIKKNKQAARKKGRSSVPSVDVIPEDNTAAAAPSPAKPAAAAAAAEDEGGGLLAAPGAVDLAATIGSALNAQMAEIVGSIGDDDDEGDGDEVGDAGGAADAAVAAAAAVEAEAAPEIPSISVVDSSVIEDPKSAADKDYEGLLMQLSLASSMKIDVGDSDAAPPAAAAAAPVAAAASDDGDVSDNDSEFGDEDDGADAAPAESVFERIERLRAELEADLGFDTFFAAFKDLREVFSGEDPPMNAPDAVKEKLLATFGEGKENAFRRLEELVKTEHGIFF